MQNTGSVAPSGRLKLTYFIIKQKKKTDSNSQNNTAYWIRLSINPFNTICNYMYHLPLLWIIFEDLFKFYSCGWLSLLLNYDFEVHFTTPVIHYVIDKLRCHSFVSLTSKSQWSSTGLWFSALMPNTNDCSPEEAVIRAMTSTQYLF